MSEVLVLMSMFILGFFAGLVEKWNIRVTKKIKTMRRRDPHFCCPSCGLDLRYYSESLHDGVISIKKCDHCDTISNWKLSDDHPPLPVKRPIQEGL